MARIRTIKPEFPQSESMGRVSREARLCFVLLWTLADDEGRLRGNSRMLASLLFPYDDDAAGLIDGWLAELEREECVERYLVDGTAYLAVSKWLSHQKIDKPSRSKIPAPTEGSRILAKPREESSEDQGSKDQGSKDQGGDQSAARKRASRKAPADFVASPELLAWAEKNAPLVDVKKATEKFCDHTFKTAIVDWPGAWRNWLRKDQEALEQRGGRAAPAQARPFKTAREIDEENARKRYQEATGRAPKPAGEVIDVTPAQGLLIGGES